MLGLALALVTSLAAADTPVDGLPPALRARFGEAEAAWSTGRLDDAEQAFGEVIDGAPTFDRALRRRCGVRLALERGEDALADCERALALVDGHENRTALALALLKVGRARQARAQIDAVVDAEPDYLPARVARCAWAAQVRDRRALAACADDLEARSPDTPGTLFYRALALAEAGQLSKAREVLLLAEEKGLDEALLRQGSTRVVERLEASRARRAARAPEPPEEPEEPEEATVDLSQALPFVAVGGAVLLVLGLLWYGHEEAGGDGEA